MSGHYDPLQPRNRIGEWTNGAAAVSSHFTPSRSAARTAAPSRPATRATAPQPPAVRRSAPAQSPSRPAPPSVKGAQSYLASRYGQWKAGMTPAQEKALAFYQSPGFALMNGQLRGADAGDLKRSEHASDSDLARARKATADLTKAIRGAPPLAEPVTVYRAFSAGQFGALKPGQVITDKGFTSTSLTDDVSMVGRGTAQARAEISLPAGTRAGAGSARELVLPPGAKFRVVSAGAGGKNVKLQYIPPGGA